MSRIQMLLVCALILAFAVACSAKDSAVVLLTPSNTVTIRGPIMPDSVQKAQLELMALDSKRTGSAPIYLVLDSPGGSIQAGLDLIETTKTIKNLKTITLFGASMASAIAQQIQGERLITESGTMMFHRAAGGFQGQFETGEVESQLEAAKLMVRERLELPNATRMGLSLEEYKRRVVNEWWMPTGANAVANKAADRVVAVECSDALTDRSEALVVATMFGEVKVQFSGCPLLRNPTTIERPESAPENQIEQLIYNFLRSVK